LEAYGRRKTWNALIRRAMTCDYGWTEPAKKYFALYQEALNLG
jgi:glycogen synthase